MNPTLLSMSHILVIDALGSVVMIILALFCVRYALFLKREESQNVIWTYLLWFSGGLFIFSFSRSVGHLVRHALVMTDQAHIWYLLRPVTGSLNTLSFILVGAITLFFHRVYRINRQMREDKDTIEKAHSHIVKLNANLEEMVKERTQELLASEDKYRVIFEGSKDMVFICDEEGALLELNHSGIEILGFDDSKEVLGKNLFMDFITHPEGMVIKQDIEASDFLKDMEVHLKKRGGDEIVALFSASAKRMNGDKIAGFEGTVKDITMRKVMERQLLQADKLASLGQLSAGVAHEINNPLGLILGYTELILKEAHDERQLQEDLKTVRKHAMNCKKIVEDLLKFSRTMDTTKTSANLNELLMEVLEVVESNFELDNVRVIKKITSELPEITADPDKIRQVFMNLLMNGRQAIEGPGVITISTSMAPTERQILVSFRDTGCGMSPEVSDKIFDPFFTTKPTGMGTGLGLSVSYGIIQDHGGEILVESSPGKGSCFTICLPVQ